MIRFSSLARHPAKGMHPIRGAMPMARRHSVQRIATEAPAQTGSQPAGPPLRWLRTVAFAGSTRADTRPGRDAPTRAAQLQECNTGHATRAVGL